MAKTACRFSLVLIVGILSSAPLAIDAEALAAEQCQSAKLGAAGTEARDRLKCEKQGLASAADPSCVANTQIRRSLAFQRAESRGGCLTEDDSGDIGNEVIALAAAALAELRPGAPAASSCTGAQLSAMGRALRRLARAYARDKRSPDPARLAAAVAATQGAFESSFAKAVKKGDCLSDTTSGEAYAIVANAVARLRSKLWPMCGDEVRAPGEQCDGSDTGSCGGACNPNCTCAPFCPCWTGASLVAAFPLGLFDQNGLGGAVCEGSLEEMTTSITSQDTCSIFVPGPPPNQEIFSRAGFVLNDFFCFVASDLDPDDNGQCSSLPQILEGVSPAEQEACFDEILGVIAELAEHCPD